MRLAAVPAPLSTGRLTLPTSQPRTAQSPHNTPPTREADAVALAGSCCRWRCGRTRSGSNLSCAPRSSRPCSHRTSGPRPRAFDTSAWRADPAAAQMHRRRRLGPDARPCRAVAGAQCRWRRCSARSARCIARQRLRRQCRRRLFAVTAPLFGFSGTVFAALIRAQPSRCCGRTRRRSRSICARTTGRGNPHCRRKTPPPTATATHHPRAHSAPQ